MTLCCFPHYTIRKKGKVVEETARKQRMLPSQNCCKSQHNSVDFGILASYFNNLVPATDCSDFVFVSQCGICELFTTILEEA